MVAAERRLRFLRWDRERFLASELLYLFGAPALLRIRREILVGQLRGFVFAGPRRFFGAQRRSDRRRSHRRWRGCHFDGQRCLTR
jgi:hypothetical protein